MSSPLQRDKLSSKLELKFQAFNFDIRSNAQVAFSTLRFGQFILNHVGYPLLRCHCRVSGVFCIPYVVCIQNAFGLDTHFSGLGCQGERLIGTDRSLAMVDSGVNLDDVSLRATVSWSKGACTRSRCWMALALVAVD